MEEIRTNSSTEFIIFISANFLSRTSCLLCRMCSLASTNFTHLVRLKRLMRALVRFMNTELSAAGLLFFFRNVNRTSFSPTVPPFAARISRVIMDRGTWRLKWEHLKAGESNGKLPPRTCPGCSVPEPYQSHDWALVPAKPSLQG